MVVPAYARFPSPERRARSLPNVPAWPDAWQGAGSRPEAPPLCGARSLPHPPATDGDPVPSGVVSLPPEFLRKSRQDKVGASRAGVGSQRARDNIKQRTPQAVVSRFRVCPITFMGATGRQALNTAAVSKNQDAGMQGSHSDFVPGPSPARRLNMRRTTAGIMGGPDVAAKTFPKTFYCIFRTCRKSFRSRPAPGPITILPA